MLAGRMNPLRAFLEADVKRKLGVGIAVVLVAAGSMAAGQGRDVNQMLAGARTALGGEKLAAVKTLTAVGRTVRALPNGTSAESEFEMTLELPDKYLMRSVLAAMGNMSVYRNSGFNGGQVIEEIDRPPSLAGGGVVHLRIAGPGGVTDPEKLTAEQKVEFDQKRLVANKREFAKLALGMFAMSPAAYPVELSDGGQAESPDGKADVIEVKGEGGFSAKLFIDAQTHLPLMLSWMDKEPLVMTMGPGGTVTTGGAPGAGMAAGGGNATFTRVERERRAGAAANMTPEEREKMMAGPGRPPQRGRGQAAHGRVPDLLRRLQERRRHPVAPHASSAPSTASRPKRWSSTPSR